MYKTALLIPIIALIISPSIHHVQATTAETDDSSLSEVTQNLKQRLKDSLTQDDEATPSSPTQTAKSYIGIVKDVIKDTLIIQDKDGKKDIKLQEDTAIIRTPGNATIKAENIRIEDYIIAIGYPGDGDILSAKRLVVSADPIKPPVKQSDMGTIVKISADSIAKSSMTLQIDGQPKTISISSKIIVKSSAGTIDLKDLSVGDTVIFTAYADDKDALTASIIMRIKTAAVGE